MLCFLQELPYLESCFSYWNRAHPVQFLTTSVRAGLSKSLIAQMTYWNLAQYHMFTAQILIY